MKKNYVKCTAVCLVATMMFSSCASIVSTNKYPMTINSNPIGASIDVTDRKGKQVFTGVTPATVTLKSGGGYFKRAEYSVKLTSAGFEEQVIPVKFKVNGWYWGNLVIGGLFGFLIVDPATGAMYKLDTPPINVTMKSLVVGTEPRLEIIDINSLTPEQQKALVKLN